MLDLLEWLVNRPRSYEETMDAWRTSCPRLPVCEDANERGFVAIQKGGGESAVQVTPAAWEFLKGIQAVNSRPARAERRRFLL